MATDERQIIRTRRLSAVLDWKWSSLPLAVDRNWAPCLEAARPTSMIGDDTLGSCWQYLQLSERGPSAVNTDRLDRWSRTLTAPAPPAATGPASTPRLDRVARVLGAST